ncbi:hypothetical protein ROLI_035350 [Roseobacter fucihabitans]|uniref:Uncharacterized protein n=1 Tax=Roseobacter fucihabitans TaxID=1537242 RepID=A0ABZ2BYF5_9RHOB|nr:hypothetical protein [Roseobacter litoralis]MBC6966961.1 hypothetical protein [Roseobacter litoralis]
MFLHKFCHQKYKVTGETDYIRLGSLSSYRTIENISIKDELEGVQHYRVIFSSVDLPASVFNSLQTAARFGNEEAFPRVPGRYLLKTGKFSSIQQKEGGLLSVTGQCELEYVAPNGLIFCMSIGKWDLEPVIHGYNSRWSIHHTDIAKFGQALKDGLQEMAANGQIELRSGDNKSTTFTGLPDIDLSFSPVVYEKSELTLTNLLDDPTKKLEDLLWDAPFRKPKQFLSEYEFRFLFMFRDGNIPLDIADDFLLMPLKKAADCLVKLEPLPFP